MAKNTTIFVCSECGGEYLNWQGKCQFCGEWNTLKEIKNQISKIKNGGEKIKPVEVVSLDRVIIKDFQRISTKIKEFDRVLGGFVSKSGQGGIVPGSVILLGGDPGIGKSTLLLQLSGNVASEKEKVLYISGEESAQQLKLRFDRLGIKNNNISVLAASDINNIIEIIIQNKPKLVIVDSIQTMYNNEFPSTPGSVVQVRECSLRLQQLAKQMHIPIIMVGHITKSGEVAGPKILEHMVDVVLYLEGERYHNNRILRGVKNRFGATDEIGIFEMVEGGLKEIINPSKIFLEERLLNSSGSVVTAAMEGTRPFLIEIQALTSKTSFGYPRRASSGYDLNRLQLIIAILQKRAGINLFDQDIYINVVGGFKIKEPAADLAVALAIVSACKNKNIASNLVVFGELGLSGEIRTVSQATKRINEAMRLGFNKTIKSKTIEQAIKESLV